MPFERSKPRTANDPLAFSTKKQSALLGHALTNRPFFLQVHAHLQWNWFYEVGAQATYTLLQEFYAYHSRFPNGTVELTSCGIFQAKDAKVQAIINEAVSKCLADIPEFGRDVLLDEFGLWAKSLILEDRFKTTSEAYNNHDPGRALEIYEEGYRLIQSAKMIGGGDAADWDLDAFHRGQKADLENGITFGCPMLDHKLNPSANGRALLRGDMTVVLAPSNVGKTTCLVTVAAHNILEGKSVLFLTHEGRPEDIKFKVLCCILQVTKEEFLVRYQQDKLFHLHANLMASTIKAKLTYIPFNKPFANITEVEALIRRLQDQRTLDTGSGYDLLIDDYPALLYTEGLLSGKTQKRISDEQVYGAFASMGLEMKFHVLVAIQTNREGSKVNRGEGAGSRLLAMEDVMESWGVMTKATNVLTMNRSLADILKRRVTFFLAKSRSSETGWAFVCQSDYARSTTHAPMGWPEVSGEAWQVDGEKFLEPGKSMRSGVNFGKYGCTAYQGADATTDRLDNIIHSFRGREIPGDQLTFALNNKPSKGMVGSAGVPQAPPAGQPKQIVVQSVA